MSLGRGPSGDRERRRRRSPAAQPRFLRSRGSFTRFLHHFITHTGRQAAHHTALQTDHNRKMACMQALALQHSAGYSLNNGESADPAKMTDSKIDFVKRGPSSLALLQNEASAARGSCSKHTCNVRWRAEPAAQMITCHTRRQLTADHLHEQQSGCTACRAVRVDQPSRCQLLAAAGNTQSSTAPCAARGSLSSKAQRYPAHHARERPSRELEVAGRYVEKLKSSRRQWSESTRAERAQEKRRGAKVCARWLAANPRLRVCNKDRDVFAFYPAES
jgi:hypothetical protein